MGVKCFYAMHANLDEPLDMSYFVFLVIEQSLKGF